MWSFLTSRGKIRTRQLDPEIKSPRSAALPPLHNKRRPLKRNRPKRSLTNGPHSRTRPSITRPAANFKETLRAAAEEIINFAVEHGISKENLGQLYATQPIMRSSDFSK